VRLLGLDFEGTGLDTATARITEYGAVLYDWDARVPLIFESELVDPLGDPLPQESIDVTGITNDMVEEFGVHESVAVERIRVLIDRADYVVAHFGNLYDRPLYEAACRRYMSLPPEKVWIDTAVDPRYPERIKTRNLQHLAAEHGLLNPFRHRAVFDVMTMMSILAHYPIEDVVARAKEPMVFIQADVSFDDKEKAKERGYRWCPPKRVWWRAFKESDAIAERKECGFSTKILPEAPE